MSEVADELFSGTSPARYEEVISELDLEIERVQYGGVKPEELKRCQTRLKAARRQSLQTNGSRAMHAGLNATYGQPINDWQTYDAKIDAITIKDLASFAQKYFKPSLRTQLVVKP